MQLVRQLYRRGYAPEQVSAGVVIASMEPEVAEPEPTITYSPWIEGPSGHNWRRTSEGVIECDFDTGPSEVGDVPIADVAVVAQLLGLLEDTARLDFLQNTEGCVSGATVNSPEDRFFCAPRAYETTHIADTLREAIDAARAAEVGP